MPRAARLLLMIVGACTPARQVVHDAGVAGDAADGGTGGSGGIGGASSVDAGPHVLMASVGPASTRICPGECVELQVNVEGGVAPYRYLWDDGLGAQVVSRVSRSVCPNATRSYAVTVSDSSFDSEFTHKNPDVAVSAQVIVDQAACSDAGMSDAGMHDGSRRVCQFQAHVTGEVMVSNWEPGAQPHVDADGNVILALSFHGTITSGALTFTSVGAWDGLVIKLSSDCSLLWVKAFPATGGQQIALKALTSDHDGNLYVGGFVEGETIFDPIAASEVSGPRGLVFKLDRSGNVMWHRVYTSAWSAVDVTDLALDSDGRLTLIGAAGSDTSFGGLSLGIVTALNVPFLAQLDTAGGFRWSKAFSSGALQYALEPAPDGSLLVAGWSQDRVDFGAGALDLGVGGRYLAALTSTGQQQWLRPLPRGADQDQWDWWHPGLAVDREGNVILLRDEPATQPDGTILRYDAIEKYASSNALIWTTRLAESTPFDSFSNTIAVNTHRDIVRAGSFQRPLRYGDQTFTARGDSDVLVVKVSSTGEVLWRDQLGSEFFDWSMGVATDANGHVFDVHLEALTFAGGELSLVVTKLGP